MGFPEFGNFLFIFLTAVALVGCAWLVGILIVETVCDLTDRARKRKRKRKKGMGKK